jgi:hypothetical protein
LVSVFFFDYFEVDKTAWCNMSNGCFHSEVTGGDQRLIVHQFFNPAGPGPDLNLSTIPHTSDFVVKQVKQEK